MIILDKPKKDLFGNYIDVYKYYYLFIPKNLVELAKNNTLDTKKIYVIFNNTIITLQKALEIINKYNLHNIDKIITKKQNIIDMKPNSNIFESLEKSILNNINSYKKKKRYLLKSKTIPTKPPYIKNPLFWYLSNFNEKIYIEIFTNDYLEELKSEDDFFNNKELLKKYNKYIDKNKMERLLNLFNNQKNGLKH